MSTVTNITLIRAAPVDEQMSSIVTRRVDDAISAPARLEAEMTLFFSSIYTDCGAFFIPP